MFADCISASIPLSQVHYAGAEVSFSLLIWSPLIMAALRIADADIFCPVISSNFFFPRLISAVADWMSTILPHMVWP